MREEISNNTIQNELNKRIKDPRVVDRIIYMFWDMDAYRTIISIKGFFELLLKYIDSKGTDFNRYQIYQYFIFELSPKSLTELKKVAVSLELLQQNELDLNQMLELLKKLSIVEKEVISEIFSPEVTSQSKDNKFSFTHHTIQEFLASKFILEQSNPLEKFEEYAILDQESIFAIKPSWYGVIRFLAESDSGEGFIERIIEIIKAHPDNIDENFVDSICSLTYGTVNEAQSNKLFDLITAAYKKKAIWLPTWASKNIWRLVTQAKLADIKSEFDKEVISVKEAVIVGNYISVIEGLLENQSDWIEPDIEFYKSKLISLSHEEKGYGVVQRRSLKALEHVTGDEEVLNEVGDLISSKDKLVREALLDLASTTSPNSSKTIDLLVEGFKKDNAIHAREGLYAVDTLEGIKHLLERLVNDEDFRAEFLDDESIFSVKDKKGDEKLVENIMSFKSDNEVLRLLKELITTSYGTSDKYYGRRGSPFLIEMTRIITVRDPNFAFELIDNSKDWHSIYDLSAAFVYLISEENFDPLTKRLYEATGGEKWIVNTILSSTQSRGDEEGKRIYNDAIVRKYIEVAPTEEPQKDINTEEGFKKQLQPSKGKFNPSVFRYFCERQEYLKSHATEKELARLKKLIVGTVLEKWDPKKIEISLTARNKNDGTFGYTITSWAPVYGDALRAAVLLNLKDDVQKYRDRIISFIPHAYSDEQEAIKDLLSSVKDEELEFLNSVFLNKESDARYHLPSSYTYLIPKLLDETPDSSSLLVYKSFIEDEKIDGYVRVQAIQNLEKCLDETDRPYLVELFNKYISSSESKEKEIAEKANEFLISHFKDKEAIDWRFQQLKERAKPFEEPEEFHAISPFEDELHSMKFTSVLIRNLDSNFLGDFIELLDYSFGLPIEQRAYINYLWRTAVSYFKEISKEGSLIPFIKLVKSLDVNSEAKIEVRNWFSSQLEEIRTHYINMQENLDIESLPKESINGK